jgi:hypothetical protein
MGGDEPDPFRDAPGQIRFQTRLHTRFAKVEGLSRPMVIIFKGPAGEVVDIDQIPGLKFLFQAGNQGTDLFPVHDGAEVFSG